MDNSKKGMSRRTRKSSPAGLRSKGAKNVEDKGNKGTVADGGSDGREVVFVKGNVSVHPTEYASERISGRLRLVKQGSSLFMTWIPYNLGSFTEESTLGSSQMGVTEGKAFDKERNLYSIRAVSLSEMRSIRRHTPPLGWHYIIIVLASGLALPPLYFQNGGIREFLATLKQHTLLVRSADDSNVYLINDTQDPLQRSLTSLELTEVVPVSSSSTQTNKDSVVTPDVWELGSDGAHPSWSGGIENMPHKPRDAAHEFSMNVLEKFSVVTKFARNTTTHLIGSLENLGAERSRRPQHQLEQCDLSIATVPSNSPESLQGAPMMSDAGDDFAQNDPPALVWGRARPPPLGKEEWATFFDAEGRVFESKALKKRVFYGGVEPSLRYEVWKFLLEHYDFNSTYKGRKVLNAEKKETYKVLKTQWQSISADQVKRFAKFRERKNRIEKDVVRTDRSFPFYAGDENPNLMLLRDILITYSFYNFDLGYCQGMNDLLSPILYVMKDEAESFWCFAALMERLAPNFHRDQNGMHSQLQALLKLVELLDTPLHNYFKQADCLNYFFCFRWILIQFKREFDFDKVMRLWEVLWTRHLSDHFHLYICVAILKRHRRKIMEEQMEFDTLLQFINELSGHIDLDPTLRDAEALCVCAGEGGAACIPPGTPPSISVCENKGVEQDQVSDPNSD